MKLKKIKQGKLEIEYLNFGKKGKNIIIIPGLFSSVIDMKKQKYLFKSYYKELSKEYNLFIFGKNKHIFPEYSIDTMADDLIQAISLLKIEKAYVIGISQGGMIAQTVAIKKESLVEKLVLCVTTPKTNSETKALLKKWIALSNAKEFEKLVVDVIGKTLHDEKIEKLQKFYFLLKKIKTKVKYDKFMVHVSSCIEHNMIDHLYKIKCPTFIVAAKKDEVISYKDSLLMHKKISNSIIKVYDNMEHDVYSNNKEVNRDTMLFLK